MEPLASGAAAGAVVWLLDGAGVGDSRAPALRALLSESEAARYQRFLRPGRQRQFLLGRMLLRQVVGRLLAVPVADIGVTERPDRAPRLSLADPDPNRTLPHFSLSHSGRWIACALSADTALGLDIEVIDARRDLAALARQAFGAERAAALARLPQDARAPAFYQTWSKLEALYKLGECAAPVCVKLSHPELSVVLCAPQAFVPAPALRPTTLDL